MPKTKQITPTAVKENWSYVTLPSGEVLQFKHVVMGILEYHNEDGSTMTLEDGTPMYGMVLSNVIIGLVPSEAETISNKSSRN